MQRHCINSGQQAEIRLPTVKDFYSQNEELFDVAVDAVVRGCVSQYHFDDKTHKFSGSVASLDGNEMYEVESVRQIEYRCCFLQLPVRGVCYHIGALALHSGYETPIFSYQQRPRSSDSGSDSSEGSPQPLQEVYVKMETFDPIKPIDSSDVNSCASIEPLNTTLMASEESLQMVPELCTSNGIPSSNNDERDPSNDGKNEDIKSMTTGHICPTCDKMCDDAHELEVCDGGDDCLQKIEKFCNLSDTPLLIPMFQCAISSSRKTSTRDLESHMRFKHASNECNICGVFLLTAESKQRHITDIHEASQNKFPCGKCSKNFTTEKALHHHKCEHSEKHKCYACCRMFSTDKELKEHKNQSAHCTYKCSVCQRIFHNSENYNHHINRMHHNLKETKTPQAFSMLDLYGKHLNARRFSNLCKHYELVHHLEPVKSLRKVKKESKKLVEAEAETESLSTV